MYNNMVRLEVMIMNHDYIDIKGARENNLKNIDDHNKSAVNYTSLEINENDLI